MICQLFNACSTSASCWAAIAANAVWIAALAAFVALWQLGKPLARWAFDYPRAYEIPLRSWIGSFMRWLIDEASFGLFTFTDLTRFIAAALTSSSRPSSSRKLSKLDPNLLALVAILYLLHASHRGLQVRGRCLRTLLLKAVKQNQILIFHRKQHPSDARR